MKKKIASCIKKVNGDTNVSRGQWLLTLLKILVKISSNETLYAEFAEIVVYVPTYNAVVVYLG
jgi:hypothetical protein